jgi:acyl carrier protein
MTQEEILTKMEHIFHDVFHDDAIKISMQTNAGDIEAWDSLNHINLVSAIEQAFHIQFALGELQELENVGDMIHLMIKEKL